MNSEPVQLPHFNLELTCEAVDYALQLDVSPFMHVPADEGDLSIQVLLNMGCDPSVQNLALRRACRMKNAAMVKRLLGDPRVLPHSPEEHLIESVVHLPDITILHMLLRDKRIDPGENNSLCLYLASACDNLPAVSLLLEDGRANPLRCNGFRVACGLGHVRIVALYMFDKRMRSSEALRTMSVGLEHACIHCRSDVVSLLLDDGRAELSLDRCKDIASEIAFQHRGTIASLLMSNLATHQAGEYLRDYDKQ